MIITKVLSAASFLSKSRKLRIGILVLKLGILTMAYVKSKDDKHSENKKLNV